MEIPNSRVALIRNSLIFMLSALTLFSNAQKFEKYKKEGEALWGLKNKKTGEIVVPAQFPFFFDFNDSLIIVKVEDKEALYNLKGEILIDYTFTDLMFADFSSGNCKCDSSIYSHLMNMPDFNPRLEHTNYMYRITTKGECLFHDYYPCPAWENMANKKDLKGYEQWLLKGEQYKWQKNKDSAIFCCKKAIELEPDNPSIYFWGAILFFDRSVTIVESQKEVFDFPEYYDWVKYCVDKASELETRPYERLEVLQMKKRFYKHALQDKKEVKQIMQEVRTLKLECLSNK